MARDLSPAGAIILILFALPFIGLGLFFAFAFAFASQAQNDASAYFASAFGLLFAVIGFGLVAAAVYGYRESKRQGKLAETYPESPWMWKVDWSNGRASGRPAAASIAAWIAAFFLDVIVAGLAVSMAKTQFKGPAPIVIVIFGAIGLYVTALAIKQTVRRQRFGTTWFEFVPGSLNPGGRVRGTIHLRIRVDTPHGFDLKLSCVRRIVTGSGKSQTVNKEVLWSSQQNVEGSNVQRSMSDEGQLPVSFDIPADAYESNDSDISDQVIWKLHASADVAGVDFDDEYVLPVFRANGASMAAAASATTATTFAGVLPKEVPAPANTQVKLTQDERGTVLEFGAFRNPGATAKILAFGIVWGAVVFLLFTRPAEGPVWFFRVMFGLAFLFILYGILQSIFGSASIVIGSDAVTVTKSLAGVARTRRLGFAEILKIAISDNAQLQSGGVTCGIRFTLSSGLNVDVADGTLKRGEALWAASVIERAMGRSDRIGTEFNAMGALRAQTAPPQMRGLPSTGGREKRTNAVSLIFVIAMVLFMGSVFFRISRTMSKAATYTRTAAHVVPAGIVTDEDVTRLESRSPQAFAEELLERAISHDDYARELLMRELPKLTSRLTLKIPMVKLEERSRYSRDLRVRQLNVAVNLAIAQYEAKDGAAKGMLDFARQNPSSRSSAVYYAGMLGSMESDKDAVVEEMKPFALRDPDPKVRQWAVEGLRFFNTEKALEVEWEAFTTDPSNDVRDRAGCNVSDCGIFERKMRFAYVPKLINLLEDPSQSKQMHSWTAMALSEITDANVPSTRQAWEDWYAKNGAKKEAEFESMPWYQVRGDE